jgi:hypothetical protein
MDSLTDRVFNFLQQHRGDAFTPEEIAVGVGHVPAESPAALIPALARLAAIGSVSSLLASWVREGLIEGRLVQQPAGNAQAYYAAK